MRTSRIAVPHGGRRRASVVVARRDFDTLFDQYAPGLLAFLVYRVGDRQLAEDLLGDTFERALRKRRRFDPSRGDVKAWIYSIAMNLARDRARRAAVEERALATASTRHRESDLEMTRRVELRHTVTDALAALGAEEQEAIALRYGADLAMPEIAELLDVPLSTVEGRVYRALRKLRTELED